MYSSKPDLNAILPRCYPSECSKRPANVMFVYDSYMPAATNKAVVSSLIQKFSLDASIFVPDTKIGVLTQSCVGGGYTAFQSATDLTIDLKGTIAGLERSGMYELVKRLRLDIFPGMAARGDRQNIAILVLDESNANLNSLKPQVRLMKANNVKVIVVAVGNVPEPVVRFLASNPVEDHVIRVDSYDKLEGSINVMPLLCGFEDKKLSYDIDVKYLSNDQGYKVTPSPTSDGHLAKTTVKLTKVNMHQKSGKTTTMSSFMEQGKKDMETSEWASSTTEKSLGETSSYIEKTDYNLLSDKLIRSHDNTGQAENDDVYMTSASPQSPSIMIGNPETGTLATEGDAASTINLSTEAPSTINPSTETPSTINPSTEAPSTINPSTEAPSTINPLTEAQSTINPLTEAPSTTNPSTEAPSTINSSTETPSTINPSTETPSTINPSTDAPSTINPSTEDTAFPPVSTELEITDGADENEAMAGGDTGSGDDEDSLLTSLSSSSTGRHTTRTAAPTEKFIMPYFEPV